MGFIKDNHITNKTPIKEINLLMLLILSGKTRKRVKKCISGVGFARITYTQCISPIL
jgi:hypothetical protein